MAGYLLGIPDLLFGLLRRSSRIKYRVLSKTKASILRIWLSSLLYFSCLIIPYRCGGLRDPSFLNLSDSL